MNDIKRMENYFVSRLYNLKKFFSVWIVVHNSRPFSCVLLLCDFNPHPFSTFIFRFDLKNNFYEIIGF